jgi:hypothetical protein
VKSSQQLQMRRQVKHAKSARQNKVRQSAQRHRIPDISYTYSSRKAPAVRTLRSPTDWLTARLLLALASRVILRSESHGTHDHSLLSVVELSSQGG